MSEKKVELLDGMLTRHGETMRGILLYRALGFRTYSGFYKAMKDSRLPIRVFPIAGRRGLFAMTSDVAAFLISSGQSERNGD